MSGVRLVIHLPAEKSFAERIGETLRIPEISVVELYLENTSASPVFLREYPFLISSPGKPIKPFAAREYYRLFCPVQSGCLPYPAFGWMKIPLSRPPWPFWQSRIRRPDTRSAAEWQEYLDTLALVEDEVRESYELLPGHSAMGRFAFPRLYSGQYILKIPGMPDFTFEQKSIKRYSKPNSAEVKQKLKEDDAWFKKEERRLKESHRALRTKK
ncbi:MAG: hypothetical protein HS115_08175 [Spirochaetales bacterium]|nr:hypothetical protein [Spirochaetales bacterium]